MKGKSLYSRLVLFVFVFYAGALVFTSQVESAPGEGQTKFHVNDPMKRNSVTFKSQAPLEDIVGTSNEITGYLTFDPDNPKKGGHGKLSLPVASLNTGIPLRNEHLQSADWLNAKNHPEITLEVREVKKINRIKSGDGSATYDVVIEADFSLNGKTKRLTIPGRLTYLEESEKTKARLPGDLLAARADFDVSLSDFGISGPKGADLIGSKVGEKIAVEVSLVGSTASPNMASNPCNPCSKKASNPCNPCSKKTMNPCNPCGKKAMNPCNPCGAKAKNPCNPCGNK